MLLLFLLAGCGVPTGQFRIRGEYGHLDKADFLILSTDGGIDRIDTLHVVRGEFEYLTTINGDATFRIVYPNDDELILWIHSGDDISIEGDALDLSKVKVKGNKENELYTQFRLGLKSTDTLALRNSASEFIRNHPESPVSLYLLQRYFLLCGDPAAPSQITSLYKLIQKAQPRNNDVARLGGKIQQRFASQKGKRMPDFELETTDSLTHKLADYKGESLLVYFWAGWMSSASSDHGVIADSMAVDSTLHAISYSLDVDSLTFKVTRNGPMLDIPAYCDYLGFQSPLVQQLGITQIPYIILVDPKGIIQATGTKLSDVLKKTKD